MSKDNDTDLADVLGQFTTLIMNERARAYNEGVDAERERCAKLAESWFGNRIGKVSLGPSPQDAIAAAIRSPVEPPPSPA